MSWAGKVIGALLGLLLLRHPFGALLGAIGGHLFDLGLFSAARQRVARSFVDPLFGLIGAMAKADGRVSEREIAATESLMQRMGLNPAQRHEAIHCFNAGKTQGYALQPAMDDLKHWCAGRRDHAYILIDVLLDVVFAEEEGAAKRLLVLQRLCHTLDVAEQELATLAAIKGYAWRPPTAHGHAPPPRPAQLGTDPYAVLGVDASADERVIKRAWRKLMSEHHPDKLGDVPEMLRQRAESRAREINTAYERIKTARGFR